MIIPNIWENKIDVPNLLTVLPKIFGSPMIHQSVQTVAPLRNKLVYFRPFHSEFNFNNFMQLCYPNWGWGVTNLMSPIVIQLYSYQTTWSSNVWWGSNLNPDCFPISGTKWKHSYQKCHKHIPINNPVTAPHFSHVFRGLMSIKILLRNPHGLRFFSLPSGNLTSGW